MRRSKVIKDEHEKKWGLVKKIEEKKETSPFRMTIGYRKEGSVTYYGVYNTGQAEIGTRTQTPQYVWTSAGSKIEVGSGWYFYTKGVGNISKTYYLYLSVDTDLSTLPEGNLYIHIKDADGNYIVGYRTTKSTSVQGISQSILRTLYNAYIEDITFWITHSEERPEGF